MTSADLPACDAIVSALPFFQAWGLTGADASRALEQALVDERADLSVAVVQGEVAGFAWVIERGGFDRSAYLRLIAVSADAQGGGVGRALMDDIERRILAGSDLVLLVTESNTAARGFYERLGYTQVGCMPDYVQVGVNECIYFKPRRR